MFERFSSDSRSVVRAAKREAETLGHSAIGTEHLLLALTDPAVGAGASAIVSAAGMRKERVYAEIARLRNPLPGVLDAMDAAALESIGIDLDAVLGRLEAAFGAIAPVAPRRRRRFGRQRTDLVQGRVTFAPRSKRVLELSLREALRLKHRSIGPEHILLGLIREGAGLGARILTESAVDLAELKRRTESALSQAA